MNLIEELKSIKPRKVYSQCGEEIYLEKIFDHIGWESRVLVDLGAWDGTFLSNTKYLADKYGCKRILIDGDNHGNPEVHKGWISCHSIKRLLNNLDCPFMPDLLSIDLDGNDFFILRKLLTSYRPRVIVAEINGAIPLPLRRTIKYNPEHKWSEDDYYGFSMGLALKLAEDTDYKIIFQTGSQNIYMLHKSLIENPDAKVDLEFKPIFYHPHNNEGTWIDL